jgi:hypothetical protein
MSISSILVEGEYRKLGLTETSTTSVMAAYESAGPMFTMDEIVESCTDAFWVKAQDVFGDVWIKDQDGRGACFPAGTKVTLANGDLVNIEDMRFGHLVRTHLGNSRQCVDVMSRIYSGDMVTLEVKGWPRIRLTGDHRVWVNDSEWKRARDITRGDQVSLVKNENAGIRFIDAADWIGGELVEDGDKIGCMWSANFIPRMLELSDDFCWMLGLYCAEGSSDSQARRLCLTSHRDEVAWRDRSVAFFEAFGLLSSITHKKDSKASQLRVANVMFARLFEALCGKFANKKKVPKPILTGTEVQKLAFLRGYFAGDGHVSVASKAGKRTLRKDKIAGSTITEQVQAMSCTVSPILAQQVATLMVDVGIKPGFGSRQQRDRLKSYNVYVYGQDVARLLDFTHVGRGNNNFDGIRQKRNLEHSQLRPVSRIQSELVEGETVYDITVDQDHAFVADGIAVHNCAGYAAASALERARARRGLDYVELSGDGIYAAVNGGRDQGSGLENNMRWLWDNGIPPASEVPKWEYRKNKIPSKAYEDGKRFKGFECFALKSELELASALVAGFSCVIAVHAGNGGLSADSLIQWSNGVGNHSVCCDDLRYRNKVLQFQIPNSWGLKWGERGRGWLEWKKHLSNPVRNHMFYAIRSTIDDPNGDNPPEPKESQ